MEQLTIINGGDIYVDLVEVKTMVYDAYKQEATSKRSAAWIHQAIVDMGSDRTYYIKVKPPGETAIGMTPSFDSLLSMVKLAKSNR